MSRPFVALLCIVGLGFVIRIAGINWDDGQFLHPDERHIVMDVAAGRVEFSWPPSLSWLDPEESPVNPRPRGDDGSVKGFAYGTLPVYTVDIISGVAEYLTGDDWDSDLTAQFVGRGISILLDTATIVLVFMIAATLAGRTAGLFAATIYAFMPIAIQLSHFFTVDTWLTFFLFAGIYTCMKASTAPTLSSFALAGAFFGLAMASKSAAAPFAGIVLLAMVLASIRDTDLGFGMFDTLVRFFSRGSAAFISFLITFLVGEPFAFIEPRLYLNTIRDQADIQSGVLDAPFTQQYVNTMPFSYQFEQAIRFGLGPVAVLLGIVGAAVLAWLFVRLQSPPAAILGAWMLCYLFVILFPDTKFLRYLLPVAPALAVTAGIVIAAMVSALAVRKKHILALGVAVTTMVLSTGYGAAYSSITSSEHSRITASFWMYEHLPPGSTTSSELWDDRLPLSVAVGWSSDVRRIDDASINLYQYQPTLGDLAHLAPSLGHLPGGDELAASLRAGDMTRVIEQLGSISQAELDSLDPVRSARFQSSLMTGSAAMTSSPDLSRTATMLSREIALDGTLSTLHLGSLATALEQALDQSMLRQIYELLDTTDYYVLASNRVQSGMEQNPWRYATQIRMYELLESGIIGFNGIAEFSSEPSLFGAAFSDQDGDESYLNYDHPVVTIYEKTDLVSFDRFVQLNGSASFAQTQPTREPDNEPLIFEEPVSDRAVVDGASFAQTQPTREPDNEPLTFEEPVSDRAVVDGARWSESITGSSWGAASVWILMLVILQLAALPVARTVFRSFPDRGWGYSRLIGVILPATVIWWLSSVGMLQFEARWVVLSLALFALAAWVWLPTNVREDLRDRTRRRLFLSAELVFWVTFGLFLLYRMVNPDSWHPIWGGEKPMEFAQINAILRSATFPPADPWYSGGYINYYYYGFYLTAWLIKLTGIPIEYAFNLAQPTFIALLASTVFSTGAATGSKLSRSKSNPIWSGVIAILLVSFAGNMRAVGQVVTRWRGGAGEVNTFDYRVFGPSRAIEFAITEFPYFTGLYADLHPHVVALPITVLCIGIAASFAFDMGQAKSLISRHSLTRLVVAGFALGILYPTNAWDLPVYAALFTASVIVGTAAIASGGRRITPILLAIGATGTLAFIIALPFLRHYEALFGSIDTVRSNTSVLDLESHMGGPLLILTMSVPVLMSLVGRGRQILPPIETFLLLMSVLLVRWAFVDLQPSLIPFLDGLTVIIVSAIWLVALLNVAGASRKLDFGLPRLTLTLIVAVGALGAIVAMFADRAVLGLYLAIALSMSGIWLLARNVSLRFLASMIAAASFVGAGLEVVYLVDDLAGGSFYRMNTVFKFYNQIWVLLGIAGGSAIGALLPLAISRYTHQRSDPQAATWPKDRRQDWGPVATIALALVLVLSTAYPLSATALRLDTRFPNHPDGLTLNAYAWMEYGTIPLPDGTIVSFDEDLDVINWFNREIEGTPVIAEASFGPYRCNGSRISIHTGLPTVLGWQRHQMQQRYPEVLPEREMDVRTLYGSPDVDTKLGIINEYDIHYIVVGELERNYPLDYGNCIPMDQTPEFDHLDLDEGIATFEDMLGTTLEIAFQSGSTVVYRVVGNS